MTIIHYLDKGTAIAAFFSYFKKYNNIAQSSKATFVLAHSCFSSKKRLSVWWSVENKHLFYFNLFKNHTIIKVDR